MPETSLSAQPKGIAEELPVKVLFEVTSPQPTATSGRSREIARSNDDLTIQPAEIALSHLEQIGRSLNEVATTVMSSLKPLEAKRMVVEFGVEISADTGGLTALIVKGSGKANLKITVEW